MKDFDDIKVHGTTIKMYLNPSDEGYIYGIIKQTHDQKPQRRLKACTVCSEVKISASHFYDG
jgi:hypothetical protein